MSNKAYLRSLLYASTMLIPALALAEANDAPPAADTATPVVQLDEVVVTAEKRSERISDVPLSITAVSGAEMTALGVTDPSGLERIVPGFAYQKSTYGVPVFTIRGIGLYSTQTAISPTVGVYVDQVPLPYLAMAEGAGLDMERLEVLKGPQGIYFGENSTGGAINYIAAKPTSTFEAGTDFTYGRFNEVDADGFVSGPISDDVTARFAVRHENRGDWQESQSRPGDTIGQRNFTDGRLLVDWKPSEDVAFELNANGWQDKSDSQAAQFLDYAPARPLAAGGYADAAAALQNLTPAPKNARSADWEPGAGLGRNDNFFQLSLHGTWAINDQLELTSITAYSVYNANDPTDTAGTAFANYFNKTLSRIRSASEEVRLAGTYGPFKFTVGANYQNDIADEQDDANFISTNSGIGPDRYRYFDNIANQDVTTYSEFASADLKLDDSLTARIGARYTTEDRSFNGCLQDAGDGALARGIALIPALAGLPYNPAPAGSCVTLSDATLQTLPDVHDSLNKSNVSWRTGLDWKVDPDTLIYGNVTKGYKSGAFSPLPAVFASQLAPVTQESVLAYEVGSKIELLNRTLQINDALFYYDYDNKQILGYKSFAALGLNLPALQNVPKSSVRGAEIDITARPLAALKTTLGATYVDSHVDGHTLAPDPFSNVIDLKGEAFPNTPRWQIVSDVEYDHAVSSDLTAFLGGGGTYRSSTDAAFGDNSTFKIGAYPLIDLRAGIEAADGNWRVQIWGKNVTNQYYRTNISHVVDTVAATTGLPATYGITLSKFF